MIVQAEYPYVIMQTPFHSHSRQTLAISQDGHFSKNIDLHYLNCFSTNN